MCGRYTLKNASVDTIKVSLRELTRADWAQMLEWEREAINPTYNACPSQRLPTATLDAGGTLRAHWMRWGFTPSWATNEKINAGQNNARAETAFSKPMFRSAVQKRRCAVPIDGFYEWRKMGEDLKQPFHIQLRGGAPFFLAGIYEDATELRPATFALLTTRPNALMEPIHDRMPVILTEDSAPVWMTPGGILEDMLKAICGPYSAEAMEAWPVSRAVNSVKNNAPELVEPVAISDAAPTKITQASIRRAADERQGDLFV